MSAAQSGDSTVRLLGTSIRELSDSPSRQVGRLLLGLGALYSNRSPLWRALSEVYAWKAKRPSLLALLGGCDQSTFRFLLLVLSAVALILLPCLRCSSFACICLIVEERTQHAVPRPGHVLSTNPYLASGFIIFLPFLCCISFLPDVDASISS